MFQGFTEETVDFMWGIRFNNRRDWFLENKQTYLDSFYSPMKELADEIFDHLTQKLPGYPLTCKVSRIYKDARRLHGTGPYRDHLWLSVQQPADAYAEVPCFWFELGPENFSCGLGYYMTKPVTMMKLRARMDADPQAMEALTRKLNGRKEFVLEGQRYKKPRSEPSSKLLEPWYLLKNFSICHEQPLSDDLFSRDIVETLEGFYDFLIPFYQYFVTLDGDPDPREVQ
ncbi:MAG: DUF2461 domain-containing protein [Oscillibacter sp.]|jgi:uncharacterized protein (TIGR02453 family)|nr:DUF2461 domain-containing protein [Oscillibacter sp.]